MRKVCVVTGTRAEYGLLYWLMRDLADDKRAELQIVAAAMHLSPEFGSTYKVIERDGFVIDAKVEMLLSSDSGVGVAKSIGLGTIGFADAFERLRPDVVVVLGDRFEILAAAQAAMAARIPIAHIHGGEATEGLIDEAIRHAVTKMAHLHFVAAEPYRRRVIQMGEQPSHVFNVGATGIDNIVRLRLLDRSAIGELLGIPLESPTFLVTYHPVTLVEDPEKGFAQLLKALDVFSSARIVMTKTNADAGGREINRMVEEYSAQHPDRVRAVTSLGQLRYLSVMRNADVVIGNSSSGLLEAPAMGLPTVNVGERQRGRLRSPSVIDCEEEPSAIVAAIQCALTSEFRAVAGRRETPFGRGGTAEAIRDVLVTYPLDGILMKKFNDLRRAE
jgi:UDP-N-acetylglucosamine 2-epimerase (non-hydrolysing)/GDP/UDP-N,N'-diacetylbacillosamine 2-epimerase (hydrolysing)